MKIKANLLNKPVNFQMDDCQIEKVVELPRDQFSALVITPLTNQPFIAENKRWMFADDSAVHCLLVLGQGSGDGVLIYSAGYDYPRLAAYLPGMRDGRLCQRWGVFPVGFGEWLFPQGCGIVCSAAEDCGKITTREEIT